MTSENGLGEEILIARSAVREEIMGDDKPTDGGSASGIWRAAAGLALCAGVIASPSAAWALDKVTFGTNWLADPEAGGFYQAVVDGTYAKYGLDVTIMPGGPQTNGGLLLVAGKIEFFMTGDMLGDFLEVEQGIPTIPVAAEFQKNPEIMMSHPSVGLDKWTDLPKATAYYVSQGAVTSFFAWMRSAWGFKEENVKPYTFNSAPFIADKHSIQQGYVTSEPFEVEKQGGFKPNIFLLADYGYSSYSTLIEARRDLVQKNPDLVQRFVDASAIGWYHYLYGDNKKANEAIKKDNPEMTDEQIAYSIAKLKEYGIVDSGDTLKLGIGAMNEARIKDFFDKMVKAGIVKPDTDYKKAFTLQFVNKGVGVDLRPK
ncbi:MAG TPA: ABC transporter substrate-binding protein [Roseiarcus sp.]|nr:ABC transporter substrate-binding protein [Roseiarcus sp.]